MYVTVEHQLLGVDDFNAAAADADAAWLWERSFDMCDALAG